jgi:hypothetical protein
VEFNLIFQAALKFIQLGIKILEAVAVGLAHFARAGLVV